MGFIEKLLGLGGPSSNAKRTVADVGQALGRSADECASANRAITAADERRRMLLSDASDDEVAEFAKRPMRRGS